MRASLLKTPALDVYGQMSLDEALLDAAGSESLVLRFYEWPGGPRDPRNPHGVTFGYFQRYEEAARHAKTRGLSSSVALARRPTGGGVVFHDSDITFSLIFPWPSLAAPGLIYKDLHRGVHLGLKAQAIPSRLWSPPQAPGSPVSSCFAGPSPMDLVDESGAKFLGGALRRRRGVGLYQGSLRPENLRASRAQIIRAVTEGLSLEWKTVFMPQEASLELLEAAENLRGERYSGDGWNKRR